MGKVISLSARLQKSKSSAETPTLAPTKSVPERVRILEENTWTIVQYVEELEERVSAQERYLRKLLRLLQES